MRFLIFGFAGPVRRGPMPAYCRRCHSGERRLWIQMLGVSPMFINGVLSHSRALLPHGRSAFARDMRDSWSMTGFAPLTYFASYLLISAFIAPHVLQVFSFRCSIRERRATHCLQPLGWRCFRWQKALFGKLLFRFALCHALLFQRASFSRFRFAPCL